MAKTPLADRYYKAVVLPHHLNSTEDTEGARNKELIHFLIKMAETPLPKQNPLVLPGAPDKLRVFYGFTRISPVIQKKQCLQIIYENTWGSRNDRDMKRYMNIYYCRYQTKKEMEDIGRPIFSYYMCKYFIENKTWHGDIEAVLHDNKLAEQPNIPKEESLLISKLLRRGYYDTYDIDINKPVQLQLLL